MAEQATTERSPPSPRRVIAGKINIKRRKQTCVDREKLRAAILLRQPWRLATGPRTEEGKTKSALNGRKTKRGFTGVRAMKREIKVVNSMLREMREARTDVIRARLQDSVNETAE